MKPSRLSRFTHHASRWLLVFTVTTTLLITPASAQIVEIPDPNLRQAIREALALPDGTPISNRR